MNLLIEQIYLPIPVHNKEVGLSHLVNVVQFKVFQQQQEQARDRLDNYLLVTININTQLH